MITSIVHFEHSKPKTQADQHPKQKDLKRTSNPGQPIFSKYLRQSTVAKTEENIIILVVALQTTQVCVFQYVELKTEDSNDTTKPKNEKRIGDNYKSFSLADLTPGLNISSKPFIISDGQLQFLCATNSGFLCTYRLSYYEQWSIILVKKREGFGQLFGMETSALGPVVKSYEGKLYIGNAVFDA